MTATLFEFNKTDQNFYNNVIRDFIPNNIIDIHTHVYSKRFMSFQPETKNVSWPSLVAKENPIEDMIATYKILFQGKNVTPLIFGNLLNKTDDFEAGNSYIRELGIQKNFPYLYFSRPEETAEAINYKIKEEGYRGLKVYLSLSDDKIHPNDITIFDFLPHHQLEVLNQHGAIAMLHIPRKGRLSDPINLKQMIFIENNYPNVKLIIAHVGRAYCKADIGDAFKILSSTKNMLFDISANTNHEVFTELIKTVGTKRILFGSDMPITRMRMRRVCENNHYINIVPAGLYGDISGDPNMREASPEESKKLTFFIYQEIAAFKRAAEKACLTKQDIDDVFYNNAKRIL